MTKLVIATLAAFAFLLPQVASAQLSDGIPTGAQTQTPDVLTSVKTLNAQCATPTAGCAAGQFVSLRLGGRTTVTAQAVATNFTGTLQPFVSIDGGATWTATHFKAGIGTVGQWSTTSGFAGATSTSTYAVAVPYNATDVMVAQTAVPTNAVTVQLVASTAQGNTVPMLTAAKGSQPATAAALTTQDLKDAGRTYVVLAADGVTPAIAEALIPLTQTAADTQSTGVTSRTVTNLKTFRIQAVCASLTAGAAANRVRVALRLNTAGACIATSNLLLPLPELAPAYGTAAAAEGGAQQCVPIPDGLEIVGNGTKAICLSENAVAASGTLTVSLVGYEY